MGAHHVRSVVFATFVGLAVMLPVGFATTGLDGPWPSTALAWAGAPSDQIRTQLDRAIKVLGDEDLKRESRVRERRVALRKIAGELFDFQEVAKRSLARYWPQRTPSEQAEFVALFTDLLERSYISKIELFSGEKILINGEMIDADTAIVRTKIVTKNGTDVPVDYRMLQRGDRWLVYDVVIENVSLVANYRAQFNRILSSSSYPDLVKKLRATQEMAGAGLNVTPASATQRR